MAAQNKGFTYIPGNRKVVIIGSGYVGSTIAYALTLRDIASTVAAANGKPQEGRGRSHGYQARHSGPWHYGSQ